MSHEQFDYERTPALFSPRVCWGPLIITLDTNLLIHLAQNVDQVAGSFGIEERFQRELWDDPVPALHDLFALWFWRDVRFYLPPVQLDDGQLDAHRLRERRSVLEAFAQDFWERGGTSRATTYDDHDDATFDDESLLPRADQAPLWPPFRDSLPRGMDGVLIEEARKAAAHVFVTEDRRVLRKAASISPVIRILRPGAVLTELQATGELHFNRSASLPVPDLQSLAHFYAVVPEQSPNPGRRVL